MEELLTPAKTAGPLTDGQLFSQVTKAKERDHIPSGPILSTGDALDALRSKPDFETLKCVLQYLDPDAPSERSIHTNVPGPEVAKLVNILVGSVVPDYWAILDSRDGQQKTRTHPKERKALLRCLSGVSGLGALLVRLQTLVSLSKEGSRKTGIPETSQHIRDVLDIIANLLKSTKFVSRAWNDLKDHLVDAPWKRNMVWKEFISIIGGGKLLSTAAEALDIVKASSKDIVQDYWIANGSLYSAWVGQNAARMALDLQEGDLDAWKAIVQLLSKSFGLGYMG
jgi:telomere length regulation protein